MRANFNSDAAALSEVVELLNEIRFGWSALDRAEVNK